MNPSDRRLAVFTKDHPMLYRFYRGIVPGPIWRGGRIKKIGLRIVEIWDKGYYMPDNLPPKTDPGKYMQQCLDKGNMKIIFHGKKIRGLFFLRKVSFKGKIHNEDKLWLLIKQEDKYAVHKHYDSESFTPKHSLINWGMRRTK